MTPMELVQKYMASFYGDAPLELMKEILADDLFFEGPFHTFDSAAAYLESLSMDPPKHSKYSIVETYEKENSICLIYQFHKTGVETIFAQTFAVNNGKISKIRLIFDTQAFN